MNERVLLAIDGGPASEAALAWAVERARSMDITVDITCVMENTWAETYRHDYADLLMVWERRAHEAVPDTRVTTSLRRGNPAHALIAASRTADILIIGSNVAGTVTGILHGTVPLQVAGRSRCTTVVVPAAWSASEGGSGVVVGWADDGTADNALAFAAEEAVRREEPLTIVHAWHVPPAIGLSGDPLRERFGDLETTERDALSQVAAEVRRTHPNLTVREHLDSGSASVALVSEGRRAGLVVVGAHGRGALGGLILGSVSHDVLMNMPAPVAVVPRPDEPVQVLPEILDEYLI